MENQTIPAQTPPAQALPSKLNTKLIIIVAAVSFAIVLLVIGFLIFKSYFGNAVTTNTPGVVKYTPSPDHGVAPSNVPSAVPIPIKP